MKRKIAVVTTSRADYSHLYWPLREFSAHPDVDLKIVVMGAHLSPEFGSTIQEDVYKRQALCGARAISRRQWRRKA